MHILTVIDFKILFHGTFLYLRQLLVSVYPEQLMLQPLKSILEKYL
jgi:hypothetical protein